MNFYNVPESLKDEEKLINLIITKLTNDFQTKCDNERKAFQERFQILKNSREWIYTLEVDEHGWYRLQKTAVNPLEGCDDNIKWSKLFRIENEILYFAEHCHQGRAWVIADLKQGKTTFTYESLMDYTW